MTLKRIFLFALTIFCLSLFSCKTEENLIVKPEIVESDNALYQEIFSDNEDISITEPSADLFAVETNQITTKPEIIEQNNLEQTTAIEKINNIPEETRIEIVKTTTNKKEYITTQKKAENKTKKSSEKKTEAIAETEKQIKSVTVKKISMTINREEIVRIPALYLPTSKNIIWKSSDKDVAAVENGIITAKNKGKAVITASGDDLITECNLTITNEIKLITISAADNIKNGESFILDAKIIPSGADNSELIYESDNNDIIRSEGGGKYTAIKPGETYVSVSAENGVSAKLKITVEVPVSEINVSMNELALNKNERFELTADIIPENATKKIISWSTSDKSVVEVDSNGSIRAVSSGTAVITAVAENGVKGECFVTVKIPVEFVYIFIDREYFGIGQVITPKIKIYPENATDISYNLTCGEGGIEIIDSNKIKFATGGLKNIVLTASNGMTAVSEVKIIDTKEIADNIVSLVNKEREKNGLSPLTNTNVNLDKAAEIRIGELQTLFSHKRPDGQDFYTAIDEVGVSYSCAGENLAMGFYSAEDAFKGWMDSPGHRDNILKNDYKEISVRVKICDDGVIYAIQEFMAE